MESVIQNVWEVTIVNNEIECANNSNLLTIVK